VTPSEAKEIFQAAGRSAIRVLCFRGGDAAFIQESAKKASARHVQLDQVPESVATALEEQGLTVYRVYRVPVGSNMLPGMIPTPCDKRPALLRVSDGKEDLTFPWDILGNEAPTGTFVSGNVRPENVCALLTHRVYGIDICRGVERAPGIKDEDRMAMFFDSLNAGY
jgi:phosphoribosylanthranilate isomerase